MKSKSISLKQWRKQLKKQFGLPLISTVNNKHYLMFRPTKTFEELEKFIEKVLKTKEKK